MNKRIRQLAADTRGQMVVLTAVDDEEWKRHEEFVEKFAELIVAECAKVCDDLDIDDWGDKSFDDGTYYCSRAIKQHFGVEE